MHFSRFSVLLLAVALSAAEPFAHARSDLPVDPAVVWGRLDNGLRYAVMANDQPTGKVSVRLQVLVGSLAETEAERGLAHVLEHLAFNGTTHFPPGELNKRLQPLGIGFGSHSNAHTSFDETVYKLDLPNTEAEILDLGLQVLADYAGGMLLLPEELERERGVVLAEMRDRDTPDLRTWRALFQVGYAGTVMGERFPIGVSETVKAMDADLVRGFYQAWYRPERMVLSVVGAIDPQDMVARIKAHFSGLTAVGEARPEPTLTGLQSDPLVAMVHREADADETRVSWSAVAVEERGVQMQADLKHDLALSLAHDCLRLRLEALAARDRQGPVLAFEAGSYRWMDLRHVRLSATIRDGRQQEATSILAQEWRRFLDHGPTKNEVALAHKSLAGQLKAAVDRAGRRLNPQLASQLYNSISEDAVMMTPADSERIHLAVAASLDAAALHAAFVAAWKDGRRLVAITGRDAPADATALTEQWKTAIAEPQSAPVEAVQAAFAYGERPASGTIIATHALDHAITHYDCASGIAALVQPSTRKPGEVHVRLRLALEPGPRHPAVTAYANRGFLAAGLVAHSSDELGRILAGSTVNVSFAVGEDAVLLSATCTPADLETAFQLVRAYLTDPGWRAEDLAPVRDAWLQAHDAIANDLDQQVWRRFAGLTTGDTPGRRPETREEAAACNVDLLREWLGPILATAPMTVAVVGDVDAALCHSLIEAYVASLPTRPRVAVLDSPQALAAHEAPAIPRETVRFEVPGPVARAVIQLAWPTEAFRDVKRMRRLNVLSQAVQERVQDHLREKLGHAYSPHAWHSASETYAGFGYLGLRASVSPGDIDQSMAAIRSEVERLVKEGVDADLLGQIRPPMLTQLSMTIENNGYWLGSVVDRCIQQPFRLEWAATMRDDIVAITTEEVSELARLYLASDPLVVIGVCQGAEKTQGQSEAER